MLKVDCEYDRLLIFKVDFNHVHALVRKSSIDINQIFSLFHMSIINYFRLSQIYFFKKSIFLECVVNFSAPSSEFENCVRESLI